MLLEADFEAFAGVGVFESDEQVGRMRDDPLVGDGATFQDAEELQPDDAFGRFAAARVAFVLRDGLEFPAFRREAGGKDRKRFGKLNVGSRLGMGGNNDIARDFRFVLPRFPKGLALADFPAGRGSVERREIALRDGAAAVDQ